MNIFKHSRLFIGIFLFTMILSIIFLFVNPFNGWGTNGRSSLNLGIDFTGGTKIYFPIPNEFEKGREVTSGDVTAVLRTIDLPDFKYSPPQPSSNYDTNGVLRHQVMIYTRFLTDSEQETVIKALEAKFGHTEEGQGLEINRINPLIGQELIDKALWAVLIASALMLIYIWVRFEFVSGVAAVIALLHDCILVVGVFALFGMEINATIIAAVLTVLGYSINDTIVVFDRIRENTKYKHRDTPFTDVVNDSILQTFRRSLNTSFTTVLAILVLFLFVPNIQEFCFALIVGITSGTYSSIFVASPVWAAYRDWQEKRKVTGKTVTAAR